MLEDTDTTPDELRQRGIPEAVIDIVVTLTKSGDEPYEQAVRRAASHSTASLVKRCDVDDNRDPARLAMLPVDLRGRLEAKYSVAVQILGSNNTPCSDPI